MMSKRVQAMRTLFSLTIGLTVITVTGCKDQEKGTITGRAVYQQLTGEQSTKPMQNVKIVLCRVSDDKGLPDGPVVATSNEANVERIGTIQGHPTSVTGKDGGFVLRDVPSGTYLLLYHLWPGELGSADTSWIGVAVTEAVMDGLGEKILASGKQDFWEKGGVPAVLANWASSKGFTATKGSVGSTSWGFCFSVRDTRAHPLVKVQPGSTTEVLLPIYIAPEDVNR